jgi:hypothetical protein
MGIVWPWTPRKRPANGAETGPPRPKKGRPTREIAAQRRREALADAKTELELAEMRLKLDRMRDGKATDRPLDVETIERVVAFFRQLDMVVTPRRGGRPIDEGGGLRELLELVRAGAPVLTELLTQQRAAPVGPPPPPVVTVEPAPPAPPAAIASPPPAPPPLPLGLQLVLGRLGGQEPAEAAAWLARQSEPELRQWVAVLGGTAEAELWPVLDRVAASPDPTTGRPSAQVAAVVGWLRARPEWTAAVAAELRARAAAEQNGAAG